jgi:hypothetical protein
MTPTSILILVAFAAAATLADLNCSRLVVPFGFNHKPRAYFQLYANLDDPHPQLPANLQVGYPATIAPKGQNGTLFSLQTCQSKSLKVGYNEGQTNRGCNASCVLYHEWSGARLINPATGHCLTVRSLDPYTLSDLDFEVCDNNPTSRDTARQLFVVDQFVGLDENGTASALSPVNIFAPSPVGGNGFILGKDGKTVHAYQLWVGDDHDIFGKLLPA